jgi:hypothetical protein
MILGSTFDEWIRQSSFFGGIALTVCLVAVLVLRQLELLDTALDRKPRPPRTGGRRLRRLIARRRSIARTASLCAAPLMGLFVVVVLARFAILT